jgi:glucose/arabinose dehydrogenase
MPYLAAALLILVSLLAPSSALAQAGVSYQVPADNPFAGTAGAAPEVYALGLRNPFRFSFDRATGDLLIGDVGQTVREEIDWIGAAAARGANFGWACREGKIDGPRLGDPAYPWCPVAGATEPLFDYANDGNGTAVTGGFVVRDPALTGLVGRYLYADFFDGEIRSIALDFADPDDASTSLTVANLSSFGEDAAGRLYAVDLVGSEVIRLIPGATSGTLDSEQLTGPFDLPIALATYPGDASRLFVGERGGTVRLVVDGAARPVPYLDVAPLGLSTDGERGLLSVVAAPDYASSGKLYVYYTEPGGDIRIDEFTRSATAPETADPSTRRNVLTIEHSSAANHNGGQLQFGPDGCLWVTTGDGGGGNDQFKNAQNTGALLGKLLRINPNPPGVGGPACPAAQTGAPPAAYDLTAPALSARAPRRQRVLRRRAAIVYVRCSEHCTLEAGGTLLIGHRRLRLRRVHAALVGDRRTRLAVRLRPRPRRVLRRALRRHRHPRVVLRLRASDAAGNRSALVRRGVRVRR